MARGTLQHGIDDVVAIAKQNDVALDGLIKALADLSAMLDQEDQLALAFVAETASRSCAADLVETDLLGPAIEDLCRRLSASLDSSDPFSFDDINEALNVLLFPPTPSSGVEKPAFEVPTEDPAAFDSDDDDSDFETCECADEELLVEFLTEAIDHAESAEQLLLVLESSPSNDDAINGMFRAVHSIKGSSGVLELKTLTEVAHYAESVMVRVRDGDFPFTGPCFESVLIAVDVIKQQLSSIQSCHSAKEPLRSPKPPRELIPCLRQACETGTCHEKDLADLHAHFAENEVPVQSDGGSGQSDFMRVDSHRLEQLIDLVGELVITEGTVAHELKTSGSLDAISLATRLRKVVREVQQLSFSLKMVPVGTVLQKMNRMVRDLSARLDKPCRLLIEGGDTEVDKSILECIADPLVHLVRNSLDHGIEANVQDRIDRGKPETATITLSALHRGGNLVIRIVDDGGGLDRETILRRAKEKGVVPKNANLTDQEIDQLIFKPGFSTAAEVSDISGRGVGMDVVRQNIETMRGSITVHSQPGVGTELSLALPLTLSIIDGTVLRIGSQRFIVPTLSVVEQMQASSLEFSRNQSQLMACFRGHYIAADRLGRIVGAKHGPTPKNGEVCLVVEASQQHLALVVDEVIGQQPIVIKPLGGVMEAFDCFAGGALLSGGDIAFVLDLQNICRTRSEVPTITRESATVNPQEQS